MSRTTSVNRVYVRAVPPGVRSTVKVIVLLPKNRFAACIMELVAQL